MRILGLLSILIFISTKTYSFKNHICIHDHDHGNNSVLDTFSSLGGAVYTCEDDYYLDQAKKDFQNAFKDSKKVDGEIHGIKVNGTKEQIETLKGMLREVWLGGHVLPSSLEDAKDCKTPLCIAKVIFKGEEQALMAMALSKKYGVSVSATQNEGLKEKGIEYVWSKNDLRRLRTGLSLLPNELLNLTNLKKFYITPPGYSRGEGVLAWARPTNGTGKYGSPGSISFSNRSLNKRSLFSSLHTIIHEVAHHYDYEALTPENKDRDLSSEMEEYSSLNNWTRTKVPKELIPGYTTMVDKWKGDPSTCYITSYSKQEPAENFADSMTAYILEPQDLKEKCPSHYAYFKDKVFNGKEFPSPFKHDHKVGANCLKVEKGYSIHGEDGDFLGMSSLNTDEVDYRNIPTFKLDEKCIEDEISALMADLEQSDREYYCYLGTPNALKGILSKSSEEKEDQFNSKLIAGLKEIDLKSIKSHCIEIMNEQPNCFNETVAEYLSDKTGIAQEEILKGLDVRPQLSMQDVEERLGNNPVLKCLANINYFKKIPLKELYEKRATTYCSDYFKESLTEKGLNFPGILYYSTFRKYIDDKDRKTVANQLIGIVVEARKNTKCGFWGKKKCIAKNMRNALEPYQEEFNFDLDQFSDKDLRKIFDKAI